MVYPALLPLMRTPRLSAVDWTDAPADLNGLVRFAERRNSFSARVTSHFKRTLHREIVNNAVMKTELYVKKHTVCSFVTFVHYSGNMQWQCSMLKQNLYGNSKENNGKDRQLDTTSTLKIISRKKLRLPFMCSLYLHVQAAYNSFYIVTSLMCNYCKL